MTHKLVLIRHGESQWNLENRFTGWTDVDLTDNGRQEAIRAGQLLKQEGYDFDLCYTSVLRRAIGTLWTVLGEMDRMWLPVTHSWRLNERHYGNLQGWNKAETAEKYGEDQVKIWRRAYAIAPPPLAEDDPRLVEQLGNPRYAGRAACRAAPHRVPEGHGGPRAALLERDHRPVHQVGQARDHRRPRQLAARPGQAPGRHLR